VPIVCLTTDLLKSGRSAYIDHDIAREATLGVDCILALLNGKPLPDLALTSVQVFTRFNYR
jgi:hypothetical protein